MHMDKEPDPCFYFQGLRDKFLGVYNIPHELTDMREKTGFFNPKKVNENRAYNNGHQQGKEQAGNTEFE